MANYIIKTIRNFDDYQSEVLCFKYSRVHIHMCIFMCAFNTFDVFEAIRSLNIDSEPQNAITG